MRKIASKGTRFNPHDAGDPQQSEQDRVAQKPREAIPRQVSFVRPPVVSPHVILVSHRQQKNPVLKFIRNMRWQHADIEPDYDLGQGTCALFLSLRFHLLEPEYIYKRISRLQRSFRVTVLLCHVDVEDVVRPLAEVTKIAVRSDCTLICAWSYKECARYLETYKSYESKPSHSIQERVENDYASRLGAALTAVKGVNRTDATTLGSTMRTFAGILKCSKEELSACPGIGPAKLHRLYNAFHQPFSSSSEAHSNKGQHIKGKVEAQGKQCGIEERSTESTNLHPELDARKLRTQEENKSALITNTNCPESGRTTPEGLVSEVEEF